MKITCKTCRKKFKISKKDAVDCNRSDCRVKYDSDLLTLEFKDDFINEFMADVKLIEDFQSPDVVSYSSNSTKKWTEEEWAKHLDGFGLCG